MTCTWCRQRPGVARRYDPDLPTLVLCEVCEFALWCDHDLLEELKAR